MSTNSVQQVADETLRPIPRTPGDLTPAWLTRALNAGGLDVELSTVEIEPFGEGVGMMSGLVRARLRYRRGVGPDSVVVKMPSPNDANRGTAVAFHCYEREVRYYTEAAARTTARTPMIHFSDLEGDSDFVLVMEDMRGYDIGDQVVGATAAQARLVIGAMAEFHTAYWGVIDELDYDFIPDHFPSYFSENMHQASLATWDNMAALAGDALPAEIAAVKDRYLTAIPRLQEWMTEAPRTIVHGDFRMDNMYFGNRPGQYPIAISDFQGVLRGKGAHDLAYFLSQSLPVDVRRANERDLVARWHAGLLAGGVEDYDPERAWEDYRRCVLGLWSYVTVIAGALDPSNERGKEWMREMVRRSAGAILDLELLELLPEFE
jgi:aminoglycoside phosphotransferase (APT) family kinase protein